MSNCNQIHFKMFLFRVRPYKNHHIYNINCTVSVYKRYSERKIKFSLHLNINTWIEEKKKVSLFWDIRLEARREFSRLFGSTLNCSEQNKQNEVNVTLRKAFYPCQTSFWIQLTHIYKFSSKVKPAALPLPFRLYSGK